MTSSWYLALWAALGLIVPIAGLMIGLTLLARRTVARGIVVLAVSALGTGLWMVALGA